MRGGLRNWDSKISFFVFADIITGVSGILIFVTLLMATDLGQPKSEESPSADPETEQKLQEVLRQQLDIDVVINDLRQALAAAEAAPSTEKLQADVTKLRAQLDEAKGNQAAINAQLAKGQADVLARDKTLGLTELKQQIQQARNEAETLAREEGQSRADMAKLENQVSDLQTRLLKAKQREGQLWLIPDTTGSTKEPILVTVSSAGATIDRFDHPEQRKTGNTSNALTEMTAFLRELRPVNQYLVFQVKPSGIELFEELSKYARTKGFEVGFDALEEGREVKFSTPPPIDQAEPPSQEHAGPTEQPQIPEATKANAVGNAIPHLPTNSPPTNQVTTPSVTRDQSWWRRVLHRLGML
jgi:hypothetical protein